MVRQARGSIQAVGQDADHCRQEAAIDRGERQKCPGRNGIKDLQQDLEVRWVRYGCPECLRCKRVATHTSLGIESMLTAEEAIFERKGERRKKIKRKKRLEETRNQTGTSQNAPTKQLSREHRGECEILRIILSKLRPTLYITVSRSGRLVVHVTVSDPDLREIPGWCELRDRTGEAMA